MRGTSWMALLALAGLGCTGFGSEDGVGAPGSPTAPGASVTAPGASVTAPGAAGPTVSVHARATQAPFAHDRSSAGQTPAQQRMAFRSLTLFASRDDADANRDPYPVYDLGKAPVEAGLDDGDDTVIQRLPIRALRAGHYTYARVGVAYVRFKVRSTPHASGLDMPGTFENVQVLANDTVLDGQLRQQGYYRTTFTSAMSGPVTVEGQDAPLPLTTGAGGIALERGPGGLTYGFAVDLKIDLGVTEDLHAIFEVNTHENFRWRDQPTLGFAAGVYDTTPTTFEPVVSFGANSARLYWEQ